MRILTPDPCDEVIGAPSDMSDGRCEGLPVVYHQTPDGLFAVSCWMPEPLELAALAGGAGIALWVRAVGRQHPVVALTMCTTDPDLTHIDGADPLHNALIETARLRAENDQLRAMLTIDTRKPQ